MLATFVELKELAQERLILHCLADGRNQFLDTTLAAEGVTPRGIWRVQLTDVILELVRAGEGISVLARLVSRAAVETSVAENGSSGQTRYSSNLAIVGPTRKRVREIVADLRQTIGRRPECWPNDRHQETLKAHWTGRHLRPPCTPNPWL